MVSVILLKRYENNDATPKLDVDAQTYEVFVDGEKSQVNQQLNYH